MKELSIAKIIMSLGTTANWLGGILICNWYLERFSISKFNNTTSITKYWLCSKHILYVCSGFDPYM
jgi:hypothetical protein